MMNHSVAIVGGGGFVGTYLARYLSDRFRVVVLDVKKPHDTAIDFEQCDIRDQRQLVDRLGGFEVVVNTAVIQLPEINEKKRLGYEVNVQGVQNICNAIESISSIKGLIHTGSWHVFGETEIRGILDENFGFRPDKTEERAKLYALCKIAQESIIRIVADASGKHYGVVRLGTVLGEGMPKLTAANQFIEKALRGEPITPYKHTLHRTMLYVDIQDVCKAVTAFCEIMINNNMRETAAKVLNLVSPYPITIIELAEIVQKRVTELTNGRLKPRIEIIDKGINQLYSAEDKGAFKVDISRVREFLGLEELIHPLESVDRIIRTRLENRTT